MKLGIIGYPLTYTLSPAMHNAAIKHLGIPAIYKAYPVEKVEDGVKLLLKELDGVSVTIPHKESIVPFLNDIDEDAEKIGAVNTVVKREGKLIGYNTDWIGFLKALEEKTSVSGKKVLILGAGGAARAAAYAVKKAGGHFTVSSRTFEKAKKLALDLGGDVVGWEERANWKGDIVVNATPLGMKGEMPFPEECMDPSMVFMDMVYTPRFTPLLKAAMKKGAGWVEGLRMLLFQGVEQFRIFFGADPPEDTMWRAITAV